MLAACYGDASLDIVSETKPDPDGWLDPGDVIQLRLHLADREVTCGAHWLVNDVAGGSPDFGVIDDCGLYHAPDLFAPTLVEIVIEGMVTGEAETCIGCQPSASLNMEPRPP
jgi:hypothetical protein